MHVLELFKNTYRFKNVLLFTYFKERLSILYCQAYLREKMS